MDDLTSTQRAAVVGFSAAMWGLLLGKLRGYLTAKKAETGRSLPQRVGYRLGKLWARGYRTTK